MAGAGELLRFFMVRKGWYCGLKGKLIGFALGKSGIEEEEARGAQREVRREK